MEIQTEYIVSEMVPPQARTAEQLLAEGKRLLDAGNKPGALAHLVMATNLSPNNEAAWLLRAKAASDPQEAVYDGIHHQSNGIHVGRNDDAGPGFSSTAFL